MSTPPTDASRDNEHGPHGAGIYACDGIPLPPLPDSAYPDGVALIDPPS